MDGRNERLRAGRFLLACLLAVATAGLLVALMVDVVVMPRVADERCVVFGASAAALGVVDGSEVQPDSGGCAAMGCVDSVRRAERLLLEDYRKVVHHRVNC